MKIVFFPTLLLFVFASVHAFSKQTLTSVGLATHTEQEMPMRLECINYDWEKYRIRVTFYRQNDDSAWIMEVKDSWSIYDQFTKDERSWTLSESRCSADKAIEIIGRSLFLFYGEKPAARLSGMDLEMEVITNVWSSILDGFEDKLSALQTIKSPSRADIPDEVDDELHHEAAVSPPLKKIGALLSKRGLVVYGIYPTEITFKDSLTGWKWSQICKSPGAGVLVPGVFRFDLDKTEGQPNGIKFHKNGILDDISGR